MCRPSQQAVAKDVGLRIEILEGHPMELHLREDHAECARRANVLGGIAEEPEAARRPRCLHVDQVGHAAFAEGHEVVLARHDPAVRRRGSRAASAGQRNHRLQDRAAEAGFVQAAEANRRPSVDLREQGLAVAPPDLRVEEAVPEPHRPRGRPGSRRHPRLDRWRVPRRQREAVDGRASGKRVGVGDCPEMERVAVHPTLDRHLRGLHELLDEHHVPHGQGIAVGIDGDAEEGTVLPRPARVFGRCGNERPRERRRPVDPAAQEAQLQPGRLEEARIADRRPGLGVMKVDGLAADRLVLAPAAVQFVQAQKDRLRRRTRQSVLRGEDGRDEVAEVVGRHDGVHAPAPQEPAAGLEIGQDVESRGGTPVIHVRGQQMDAVLSKGGERGGVVSVGANDEDVQAAILFPLF